MSSDMLGKTEMVGWAEIRDMRMGHVHVGDRHIYVDCHCRTAQKDRSIANATPGSGFSTMCSSARKSAELRTDCGGGFVGMRGKLRRCSRQAKSKDSCSALHMDTSRFDTMNPHVLLLLATAVSCVWLVKTFIQWLRYPAAPGPAIAAYTNYWYIWKVWQGKFEDWNIKQHAQHGKFRAAIQKL